jgi:hypothetical protein
MSRQCPAKAGFLSDKAGMATSSWPLSKGELFCQNTVPVTDLISQEELEIVILM